MSHLLETASIIVTGGAGTLGMAIAERRKREGWSGNFSVYSTSTHNHEQMARLYPDVNYVQGDIRSPETLYNAMVGHDICLHLAAVKVIPTSELYSLDTVDVNINGSINVCIQAQRAGIEHVLGISTDKVCHPANAYGATKMLMEKAFHEFSRVQSDTQFHLVRYGNVLESSGSVLEAWAQSKGAGIPIKITDPNMTRFWISPQQAVTLVINSLKLESGMTLIPKAKALSIGQLAEYTLGDGYEVEYVRLRPGEKMHETLLTVEEGFYAVESDDYIFLRQTSSTIVKAPLAPYSSDIAPELTKEELEELLRNL